MIDTIVLRIHGYEKYSHIVKHLESINDKRDGYTKKFIHTGMEDRSRIGIFYGDTDRILDLDSRPNINVPSSNYSVVCSIRQDRDFIELNFSIPKYVYSTNVIQFIDQYDPSIKHTFDKLLHVITRFFADYLPLPPDWSDVEMHRIDVCYNQFFLSKDDALRYLSEQKGLNRHYARSEKNTFDATKDTTVSYVTDNYSFKIYHKGTEFRKNDYKKLLKKNPRNLDLPEMADKADLILRYEITARNGLMNYLWKQHIKGDQNTVVNHNLGKIMAIRPRRSSKQKAVAFISSKETIETFVYKSIQNKKFQFRLKSEWDNLYADPYELINNYNLTFNVELLTVIHTFFWERVKKYQLGVKLGLVDIHRKIKQYQDDKKLKNTAYNEKESIAQTGNLTMLATLSQFTDITDLKDILPKATYYRYLTKLKELGIARHSPDIAVQPPPLDYVTYFTFFGKYHFLYN